MRHKRIVVVQPHFSHGGAETVAAWIVEAVKDLAPVTLLTFDDVTPQVLNERYGTALKPGDFDMVRCRLPLPCVNAMEFTLLKLHWFMRRCKRWPDQGVLFFSAFNEMDFGTPGIQYVNFPLLAESAVRRLEPVVAERWYHKPSILRKVYLLMGQLLSGYTEEGGKANLTLTVSNWTGNIMQKIYGISAKTVYPPVTLEFPDIPFTDRENGFVCIGRIVPLKRILNIIEILRAVRERGFDVHLHIIGPAGELGYMQKVRAAQRRHSSWVSIEGPLDRAKLVEIVAQHRFGIHGMPNEHFGIAVAEMAKAGCVVFVPSGGGQVEIVDYDEKVIYEDEQDAVQRITRVLADEESQVELGREMAARGSRFTPERFVREVREVVK